MSDLLIWPIVLAAAALLTYGGIALVIGSLRERALAKPNPRSSHDVPTPQGGGIVVVPAALMIAGVALASSGSGLMPGGALYLGAVGAAALALSIIGFVDDARGLGIVPRFLAQAMAVGLAVVLLPADLRIAPVIPLALERAALIGGALWFVNLVNFMDGIDLISVVETSGITLGVAILAALGAVPPAYGTISLALTGAMVGFAPWNWLPARLFLGDAGSIPIGFLLAVLLMHVAAENALAAAVILPLYYVADATITLARRLVRGERVWEAHRQHFYQQAMRQGMTVKEIVARIAVLDAVLVALAVGSVLHGSLWAAIAAVMAAAAAVAVTLRSFARGRPNP